MTPGRPLLRMTAVMKSFGAVRALKGVDLVVRSGEVHALIGENGAGKSTLMKVLSGAHAPDAGEMVLDGRKYRPDGPIDARRLGIAMIYQELNLAPHLTVAENVMLGRERSRIGWLRRRAMRRVVAAALERLSHPDIHPDARVANLSPGARQMVEIARALVGDARLIVMDEPTSSLSHEDAEKLFAVIGRLRARGIATVYISHFLEEVNRVATRYTVLRDGVSVGTGDVAETTNQRIIEMMVGRRLDEIFPTIAHEPGDVAMRVTGLRGRRRLRHATFELRRGEILGIAGLVGAGRTELLRALFGLDPIAAGEVTIGGRPSVGATPKRRLQDGVGLLSEDRKEEGLFLDLPIRVNVTLSRLAPLSRGGWIRRERQTEATNRWIDRLGIRCVSPSQRVGELSGGNQQKVAIARLLHHGVDVLLLDEPTRGIDVASKVDVYRWIGELAAAGKAIVFVSSYVPELLGVCDRIAVMHRGELLTPRAASDWTEREILDVATQGAGA